MIVLDTNVLSETMKPLPAAEVLEWLASQPSVQAICYVDQPG